MYDDRCSCLVVTETSREPEFVAAGAHVQLLWLTSAVFEGVGEELLQGGEVGTQGLKVGGLSDPNAVALISAIAIFF